MGQQSRNFAFIAPGNYFCNLSVTSNICLLWALHGFWHHNIRARIRSGEVVGVHFALPCQSWSRARRNDGRGPGPPRDDCEFLFGLPGLSAKDVARVAGGNLLLHNILLIIHTALEMSMPVVLENPMTSRVWLIPALREVAAKHDAVWARADYCQYGQPWRKAAFFLAWDMPGLQSLLRSCCTKHGRCSASGCRHVILQGRDAQGVFLTLRAQPYPKPLCRDLAEAIVTTVQSITRVNSLARTLPGSG